MEEMRERIDRGDADREVEEIIQVRWLSTQTWSSADSSLFQRQCAILQRIGRGNWSSPLRYNSHPASIYLNNEYPSISAGAETSPCKIPALQRTFRSKPFIYGAICMALGDSVSIR